MNAALEVGTKLKQIEQEAATAPKTTRVMKNLALHQTCRQGDIYIQRIPDLAAKELKALKLWGSQKLVRGNEGGSRHIAESSSGDEANRVRVYESDKTRMKVLRTFRPEVQLGPIIVAKKRVIVSHPEHAHIDLPGGCYQIGYQLDARTMQRVRD